MFSLLHIWEQISDAKKLILFDTSSLLIYLKESMDRKGITLKIFVIRILRGFEINIIRLDAKEQDHATKNKVLDIC